MKSMMCLCKWLNLPLNYNFQNIHICKSIFYLSLISNKVDFYCYFSLTGFKAVICLNFEWNSIWKKNYILKIIWITIFQLTELWRLARRRSIKRVCVEKKNLIRLDNIFLKNNKTPAFKFLHCIIYSDSYNRRLKYVRWSIGFSENVFYHTFIYVLSHAISDTIPRGEEHCGEVQKIFWERTFSRRKLEGKNLFKNPQKLENTTRKILGFLQKGSS